MMMTYFNTVNAIPAPPTDIDMLNKRLYDASMIERLGFGTNYFVNNGQYDNDNSDQDEILHEKRQLKKKWAKFYRGAPGSFTIAFPALIRSRRWIEQEE
jgi:hypothetical protein